MLYPFSTQQKSTTRWSRVKENNTCHVPKHSSIFQLLFISHNSQTLYFFGHPFSAELILF